MEDEIKIIVKEIHSSDEINVETFRGGAPLSSDVETKSIDSAHRKIQTWTPIHTEPTSGQQYPATSQITSNPQDQNVLFHTQYNKKTTKRIPTQQEFRQQFLKPHQQRLSLPMAVIQRIGDLTESDAIVNSTDSPRGTTTNHHSIPSVSVTPPVTNVATAAARSREKHYSFFSNRLFKTNTNETSAESSKPQTAVAPLKLLQQQDDPNSTSRDTPLNSNTHLYNTSTNAIINISNFNNNQNHSISHALANKVRDAQQSPQSSNNLSEDRSRIDFTIRNQSQQQQQQQQLFPNPQSPTFGIDLLNGQAEPSINHDLHSKSPLFSPTTSTTQANNRIRFPATTTTQSNCTEIFWLIKTVFLLAFICALSSCCFMLISNAATQTNLLILVFYPICALIFQISMLCKQRLVLLHRSITSKERSQIAYALFKKPSAEYVYSLKFSLIIFKQLWIKIIIFTIILSILIALIVEQVIISQLTSILSEHRNLSIFISALFRVVWLYIIVAINHIVHMLHLSNSVIVSKQSDYSENNASSMNKKRQNGNESYLGQLYKEFEVDMNKLENFVQIGILQTRSKYQTQHNQIGAGDQAATSTRHPSQSSPSKIKVRNPIGGRKQNNHLLMQGNAMPSIDSVNSGRKAGIMQNNNLLKQIKQKQKQTERENNEREYLAFWLKIKKEEISKISLKYFIEFSFICFAAIVPIFCITIFLLPESHIAFLIVYGICYAASLFLTNNVRSRLLTLTMINSEDNQQSSNKKNQEKQLSADQIEFKSTKETSLASYFLVWNFAETAARLLHSDTFYILYGVSAIKLICIIISAIAKGCCVFSSKIQSESTNNQKKVAHPGGSSAEKQSNNNQCEEGTGNAAAGGISVNRSNNVSKASTSVAGNKEKTQQENSAALRVLDYQNSDNAVIFENLYKLETLTKELIDFTIISIVVVCCIVSASVVKHTLLSGRFSFEIHENSEVEDSFANYGDLYVILAIEQCVLGFITWVISYILHRRIISLSNQGIIIIGQTAKAHFGVWKLIDSLRNRISQHASIYATSFSFISYLLFLLINN